MSLQRAKGRELARTLWQQSDGKKMYVTPHVYLPVQSTISSMCVDWTGTLCNCARVLISRTSRFAARLSNVGDSFPPIGVCRF